MLGMYIHTHWSYNYPYCARRWTLQDWRNYLTALHRLGYDMVTIWPQLDTMPFPRTPSDDAFLAKLRDVIDFAHGLGFKVLITLTPNAICNDKAKDATFEDRDFFKTWGQADPNDAAAIQTMLHARRSHLEQLAGADGVVIIDSDPGGWPDSPTSQFVDLFLAQARIFRSIKPDAETWFWAWGGWPVGQRLATFLETFKLIQERSDFPWKFFSCTDTHQAASDQLGLVSNRAFLPYNVVEFEPSFPMINCQLAWFRQEMRRYDPALYPQGLMVNAQTHLLQAPYTYLVAHYARGGTYADEKFLAFGEQLIPGEAGEALSTAYLHLQELPEWIHMRFYARKLRGLARRDDLEAGPLAGLMFLSPQKYLIDVADNLDLRADFLDLHLAAETGRNLKKVLRELVGHFRPYQARVGYDHAWHMQPLRQHFFSPLLRIDEPSIIKAIRPESPDPRGYLPSVLDAIEAFAKEG